MCAPHHCHLQATCPWVEPWPPGAGFLICGGNLSPVPGSRDGARQGKPRAPGPGQCLCPQGCQESGGESGEGSVSCRFLAGGWRSFPLRLPHVDRWPDYRIPPATPQSSFLPPIAATQTRFCSAFFYERFTFSYKPLLYREAANWSPAFASRLPSFLGAGLPGRLTLTTPFCAGSPAPMNGAGGPLPAGP